ncbi:MAG: hypothetical protein IT458_16520 [Planctomycetes bacterium]|nr:hypothetical protein [Planctomycetota bacterium]
MAHPFPAALLPLALGLALAAPSPAQVPSWSPEFAVAGLGGRVFAATTFRNEVHAGGMWFAAKGGVLRGVARFDGDGWRPLSTGVDLVNRALPISEVQVRAMLEYQGELVIAGTFDRAGGQAVQHIARWDGTAFRPLGAGLQLSFGDAEVRSLAIFQGELVATGYFDRAGGLPANGIARWDGTTWRALGSGLLDSVHNIVGFPCGLCVHNQVLYVGGEFDRAGGIPAVNVAAWNGTAWSAVGTAAPALVFALASYGTRLVVAGQFHFPSGLAMLAAWDGAAWAPLGTGGPNLPVMALCALGSHLYAGGHFLQPGPRIARFDGANWQLVGGVTGVYSGITTPTVFALHAHAGGLLVGGEFTMAGMQPGAAGSLACANVAFFDGATRWSGLGTGLGLDRPLRRLLRWRNVWVGVGGFTEAGTVRAVGIALYDGDRWNALADFDGPVWSAAIHQDGLVVSGAFTRIDGQPFPGIARHDGTGWRPFGGVAPTGLVEHRGDLYGIGGSGLQKWNGTGFVVVAAVSGVVSHAHSHGDGLLYVTTDSVSEHRIHTWNGTQLQPIGTANHFLHAIGSHGSDVVVGGRFTAVQGVPANLMARWDGATWRAMPAPVSGYSVDAFAELDGALYAGVSGDPRGFCLRLQNNAWQAPGGGVDGLPQVLFADRATASVYASGVLLTAAGLPSRNLAEWRTQPAWRNRLHGAAGLGGVPQLLGRGALQGGSPVSFRIEGPASTPLVLVLGGSRVDLAWSGGTLVPSPDLLVPMQTDPAGAAALGTTFPAGVPPGAAFYTQAWLLDATGPQGLTATNALQGTAQ